MALLCSVTFVFSVFCCVDDGMVVFSIYRYIILLIDEMLEEKHGIERIYINFCNPWPKDRHKKRRLTHPRQIEKYKKFLKN